MNMSQWSPEPVNPNMCSQNYIWLAYPINLKISFISKIKIRVIYRYFNVFEIHKKYTGSNQRRNVIKTTMTEIKNIIRMKKEEEEEKE